MMSAVGCNPDVREEEVVHDQELVWARGRLAYTRRRPWGSRCPNRHHRFPQARRRAGTTPTDPRPRPLP